MLDPSFIAVYNLFYTSQPVLALAYFDQDVKPELALKVKSAQLFVSGNPFLNFYMFLTPIFPPFLFKISRKYADD